MNCSRMILVRANFNHPLLSVGFGFFFLVFCLFAFRRQYENDVFMSHGFINYTIKPAETSETCTLRKNRFSDCSFRKLIASNYASLRAPLRGDMPITHLCDRKPGLCLRKWGSARTFVRASSAFHFGACVVPKTMSTVMGTLQCYLENWRSGKAYPFNARHCEKDAGFLFNNTAAYLEAHPDIDWTTIFVKRDPMDRFISAFLDRCVRKHGECGHCYMNVTCFMERQLRGFQLKTDFTRYYEDEFHMVPQSWMCDLRKQATAGKLHFVRYSGDATEAFLPDVLQVLRMKGVPDEALNVIYRNIASYRTPHSTAQSPERMFVEEYIRTQPYIQELVVRMYHNDYQLLGYDYPRQAADLIE